MPSELEATRRWLDDIREHIAKAQSFVAGLSLDEFLADELRLYAVTRCLEIISEASRRLPETLTARHPHIAWREMAAAGNVYRHEYGNVAARRIWHTLAQSLPDLDRVVAQELAALDAAP